MFLGRFTSCQRAGVSQGRICSDLVLAATVRQKFRSNFLCPENERDADRKKKKKNPTKNPQTNKGTKKERKKIKEKGKKGKDLKLIECEKKWKKEKTNLPDFNSLHPYSWAREV